MPGFRRNVVSRIERLFASARSHVLACCFSTHLMPHSHPDTHITVCTTCRAPGTSREQRADGLGLFDAVQEALWAAESEDGTELTLQDVITDNTPTPEQAMLNDHKAQLIQKALHHLDELERAILEIRYGLGDYDESTMAEVAELLGVSRATVFNYEAKALEKLKNILQNGDKLL